MTANMKRFQSFKKSLRRTFSRKKHSEDLPAPPLTKEPADVPLPEDDISAEDESFEVDSVETKESDLNGPEQDNGYTGYHALRGRGSLRRRENLHQLQTSIEAGISLRRAQAIVRGEPRTSLEDLQVYGRRYTQSTPNLAIDPSVNGLNASRSTLQQVRRSRTVAADKRTRLPDVPLSPAGVDALDTSRWAIDTRRRTVWGSLTRPLRQRFQNLCGRRQRSSSPPRLPIRREWLTQPAAQPTDDLSAMPSQEEIKRRVSRTAAAQRRQVRSTHRDNTMVSSAEDLPAVLLRARSSNFRSRPAAAQVPQVQLSNKDKQVVRSAEDLPVALSRAGYASNRLARATATVRLTEKGKRAFGNIEDLQAAFSMADPRLRTTESREQATVRTESTEEIMDGDEDTETLLAAHERLAANVQSLSKPHTKEPEQVQSAHSPHNGAEEGAKGVLACFKLSRKDNEQTTIAAQPIASESLEDLLLRTSGVEEREIPMTNGEETDTPLPTTPTDAGSLPPNEWLNTSLRHLRLGDLDGRTTQDRAVVASVLTDLQRDSEELRSSRVVQHSSVIADWPSVQDSGGTFEDLQRRASSISLRHRNSLQRREEMLNVPNSSTIEVETGMRRLRVRSRREIAASSAASSINEGRVQEALNASSPRLGSGTGRLRVRYRRPEATIVNGTASSNHAEAEGAVSASSPQVGAVRSRLALRSRREIRETSNTRSLGLGQEVDGRETSRPQINSTPGREGASVSTVSLSVGGTVDGQEADHSEGGGDLQAYGQQARSKGKGKSS